MRNIIPILTSFLKLTIFNTFVLIGFFPTLISYFAINDVIKGGIRVQKGIIKEIKTVHCRGDCPSISIGVKVNQTNEIIYILEYPSNFKKKSLPTYYEYLLDKNILFRRDFGSGFFNEILEIDGITIHSKWKPNSVLFWFFLSICCIYLWLRLSLLVRLIYIYNQLKKVNK